MPRASNSLRDTAIPLALLTGDASVTFAGLVGGWWLRYESPLGRLGIDVPGAALSPYLPLLFVGVALLVGAFAQLGLYDSRMVLRRYQSLNAIIKGTAFWLVTYLGVSLVLKFDPPISRLFVVFAFVCVVLLLHVWRTFAYAVITQTPLLGRLRRRTVLLGWNDDARALAAEVQRDPAHPLILVGVVALPDESPTADPGAGGDFPFMLPRLGSIAELESILARTFADVLIATRLEIPREEARRIVEICERRYVEWKVVPGAFDIFLSGLRLQTIGRVPVLGVEELAINRLLSRALKRASDLVGGVIGLLGSAPLMLVLAMLIKRQSPGGPVLFRQQRIGADHQPFTLYKLRSMQPDADASDSAHQSTGPHDPRLLPIGAFLRRWNLDELPQFWNVLRGDMSLVGPRPERPYHVDQLARTISHYLPRHLVKPGMTGWAQVNGLRGDTDLAARVQHDIYYIENWSLWLDVQILLLTLIRWRSPDGS
ncbi:sugar transferase [Opitutus terrae]|uniref:Exopolysaccharide biosynthesis polyprenyl glycosylphosphotransferase n=1 Tax=Opitutus terrae (strain DSM 11246 / JCM 15787 / PB90-1) TaxID=452637 RepID=B1ZVX2_OPITP|nr:sugar transferase [Opitutus terrae]ACB75058.1 exopolysaccharide biosynthesis polyprenyl glycosylphosphotransferase [Opitutus terrae PB90-1]